MLEKWFSTSKIHLSLYLCFLNPSSSHYPFTVSLHPLSLTEMPAHSITSYFLCQAACQLAAQGSGWLCVGDIASPACYILVNLLKN